MTKQFCKQQLDKTREEYATMLRRLRGLQSLPEGDKDKTTLQEIEGLTKRLGVWEHWGKFYKENLERLEHAT